MAAACYGNLTCEMPRPIGRRAPPPCPWGKWRWWSPSWGWVSAAVVGSGGSLASALRKDPPGSCESPRWHWRGQTSVRWGAPPTPVIQKRNTVIPPILGFTLYCGTAHYSVLKWLRTKVQKQMLLRHIWRSFESLKSWSKTKPFKRYLDVLIWPILRLDF